MMYIKNKYFCISINGGETINKLLESMFWITMFTVGFLFGSVIFLFGYKIFIDNITDMKNMIPIYLYIMGAIGAICGYNFANFICELLDCGD